MRHIGCPDRPAAHSVHIMSNTSWMHMSVQEVTVGEIIRLCLEPKNLLPSQLSLVHCSAVKGDEGTLLAHSLCGCKEGRISLCKHGWLMQCPAQPAAASTEQCKCPISLSLNVMLVSWKSQDPTIAKKAYVETMKSHPGKLQSGSLSCVGKRGPWKSDCPCYTSRFWETTTQRWRD